MRSNVAHALEVRDGADLLTDPMYVDTSSTLGDLTDARNPSR
jgi:hypothetical protein